MQITLGTKEEAKTTVYYRCEGCEEKVSINIDFNSGFDHLDARNVVQGLGWVRRVFTKGVDPWFCSYSCSQNSKRAKEIEKHWTIKND